MEEDCLCMSRIVIGFALANRPRIEHNPPCRDIFFEYDVMCRTCAPTHIFVAGKMGRTWQDGGPLCIDITHWDLRTAADK